MLKSLSRTIWIGAEQSEDQEYDIYDNNVDVMVTFSDRSRWVATMFTYQNIETVRKKNQQTGECMSGAYLRGFDMILVENVSRARIESIIDYLIENEEFTRAFVRISDEEDE